MSLELFHPLIRHWFSDRFGQPTEPQLRGWPEIAAGKHTLIAAPTGSGKTLAAFLVCIDRLFRQWQGGNLADGVEVVYVSPLKALSNDIQRNLQTPLAEIAALAAASGLGDLPIRTAVRTGDTPQADRQAMLRHPPHILVTTPESLYLLLTSGKAREKLRGVKTVIVDEIHALARDKRGSHLALTLERLAALCGHQPTRIGLSATQKPIEEIGAFLVGSEFRVQGSAEAVKVERSIAASNDHPKSKIQNPKLSFPEPRAPSPEPPAPTIINIGHARDLDLGLELPDMELASVCTHEHWGEIYQRLTALIQAHRSTLVFVNTRRLAERIAFRLTEQLGEDAVASHHGSLSREIRLDAEQRLKAGQLKAIVATASLEMGIDIGYIDLACQIGSPRSIATFLQRIGRSGHAVGALPKGRLFPLTRDELLECLALVRAVRRGNLDRIEIPAAPLDILAQQIVAAVAADEWDEEALFQCFCRAYPYRNLQRDDFEAIVKMLSDGIKPGNKAGTYLHRDLINGRLRARRGARLAAVTSGGAIAETAQFRVVTEGEETFVGSVDEDFAVESLAGDVFLLGNSSWMIRHVRGDQVTVIDAHGAPPTIPFWLGEAPGRTIELSEELSELRREIARRVQESGFRNQGSGSGRPRPTNDEWDRVYERRPDSKQRSGLQTSNAVSSSSTRYPVLSTGYSVHNTEQSSVANAIDPHHLSPDPRAPHPEPPPLAPDPLAWLAAETNCGPAAAEQAVRYVAAQKAAIGVVPTGDEVVFERFFDESGGMQLVVHAPLGARINKAWGLALRKRFCRSFDFELQAAADDNGVLLSIGPQHSFPIDSLFGMLTSQNGRDLLEQAVIAAPLFGVRWRWNITRSLAVLRQQGGKRVPPFLQKFRSEDLLAAAFPETVGCLENHHGPVEIPDQPIVRQTMHDCLTEAMDVERWLAFLDRIKSGAVKLIPVETREPSPFSHQLLNAQPYAFLDDAPLEERRTRAISTRRSLAIDEVKDLSRLDPAAIAQVAAEAWPSVRDADELHDALLTFVVLPADEGREWNSHFEQLVAAGRARTVNIDNADFWIAAERWPLVRAVYSQATLSTPLELPAALEQQEWSAIDGRTEILRGQIQFRGPLTADELSGIVNLEPSQVFAALEAAEASGMVMRGHFTPTPQPVLSTQYSVLSTPACSNIEPTALAEEYQHQPTAPPLTPHHSPLTTTQWCERRLLARIHRLTLDGLRRRIEPVPPETYWQWLVEQHHLLDGRQLHEETGLREVIAQLAGFELPAGVWEQKILAPRLADYDPQWLDHLFLSGELVWGRLRPPRRDGEDGAGMAALTRNMPITLALRQDLAWLLPSERPDLSSAASGKAQDVLRLLQTRGALFFQDLRSLTGLLPTELEEALRELAALGLVSSDTFAAVRAIDGHANSTSRTAQRLKRFAKIKVHRPASPIGRWSLFPADLGCHALNGREGEPQDRARQLEHWCDLLLRRYGVLFRELLAREPASPPWWELARVLRRMELRGEVRGGRFIAGVGGEQFAVEAAVSRLRDLRDSPPSAEWTLISAADPLNLAGVITAGPRIPAMHKNAIVLQGGRCVAAKIAGRIEFLANVDAAEAFRMRKSLQVGRKIRPQSLPAAAEPETLPHAKKLRATDDRQLHSRRRFGF